MYFFQVSSRSCAVEPKVANENEHISSGDCIKLKRREISVKN